MVLCGNKKRGSQPLGETDLNAVGIAHQVGGLHPQRYRRVEEAGSVDMDVEPPVMGPRRALGDLPGRRGVPSPPVVGVLEADQPGPDEMDVIRRLQDGRDSRNYFTGKKARRSAVT